jgi:RNA polymerase sporulation-specific sigma factor
MDYEFLSLIVQPLLRGFWLLVGYLTGNAFPHPLTPEEEAKMLERLAAGDPKAREILIERNLRLVAHVVKKFDNVGEEPDDLISIGTVGLIKGVDTYRLDKGTRLATYAARCIENERPTTNPERRDGRGATDGRPADAKRGAQCGERSARLAWARA